MSVETKPTQATDPAPLAAAAVAAKPAAQSATFTATLEQEMKRIASHASEIKTLNNGAKLYYLAGGREVEQAPGRTPYVVKPGHWPPPKTSSDATPPPTSGQTSPR